MAINTHQADHVEYIQDSNNKKHYLNAEYLDGHSYADISNAIGKKGTVTSVATADGITGGPITASGTIKANLKSYTKNTAEIGRGLYGVELDKNGKLAVNVPSAGFEDILKGIKGRTQVEWNALNAGEYGSNSTYNGATLPPVILENTSGFWNSASGRPLDISFHFAKKERITTLQVKCPPYSGANPTMTVYYAQKGDAGLTLYKEIATISTADRKAYEFNEEGISADYWVVRFTSSNWIDLRLCSPSGLFTTGLYTEECHQQIMDRFNGYQPIGNYALKNETIAKSLTSAKGDMIYASAANTPARLGIGSNGQFLSIADGAPKWVNNPNTDNNTSHGHSAGVGLVGSGSAGTSGGTYTYKAKLRSETALTVDSVAATTTSGRVYPVAADKSGYLSVNVPWTDTHADISNLVPYTGASKDVNLGNHSLLISDKTVIGGGAKIKISGRYQSEDDTSVTIEPGNITLAGTGDATTILNESGFKAQLRRDTNGDGQLDTTSYSMYEYGRIAHNGKRLSFPEKNGTIALTSDLSTLLDKGTSSTVVNQVVYNPVEMKKALIVPSLSGEKTTIAGNEVPSFSLSRFTSPSDYIPKLVLNSFPIGATDLNAVYTTTIEQVADSFTISCESNTMNSPSFGFDTEFGWNIEDARILTENDLPTTQQWKLTSTTGTVTTVNICVK